MFPNWGWKLIAAAASLHSVALLSTLFRLWYRWYTERMWWDDFWALLAFLVDIAWLVAAVLERPIPDDSLPRFFTVGNWIVAFAYPLLMWAARTSILTSIVRVSHPEGRLRHTSFGVGVLFGVLGTGMFGQRLQLCIMNACLMTRGALIAQTTADCFADVALTALPIWFLHSVKLSRKRRILILSALSASIVIVIVTIVEMVMCFQLMTSGSVIFEHIKAACSMIVCNLLVITTFVYRVLRGNKEGFEDSMLDEREAVEFTSIDLARLGFSQDTNKAMTLSAPSGTIHSTWSFRPNRSQLKSSGSVITTTVPTVPTVHTVSRSELEHSQA